MKKIISISLAIILCCSVFVMPVSAANSITDTVKKTTTRIDLSDGGYIIEEVAEYPTTTRTFEAKTGEKMSTRYTASDRAIYAVKVTGSFSYNGTTSSAICSDATVYIYDSGASFVSKSAWFSGCTAYATGSVKYLGYTESRTPALSCDKNGNLS